MKSKFSVEAYTWLGGLATQTFLKAFLVLLLINGFIDLVLIQALGPVFSPTYIVAGLTACLFLAWVFLLWKTEPPILLPSIFGVLPLILGVGAYLVTGYLLFWLMVIIGYGGWAIWWIYFRAPALRTALRQWNMGITEQAILTLDRYIESHPAASDAYQYKAYFRLDQAQYLAAEQDIQNALRLRPRSYFSHYLLGQILLGQGRIPEAKESLKTAVRLGPGRGVSYLPLGIIYHLETEHLLAVEAFCHGVGWRLPNASNYFVAYYYLGRNLEALGEYALGEYAPGESPQGARAYQRMARYRKGYATLVDSLQTNSSPETPASTLYRADLNDMRRRLKR